MIDRRKLIIALVIGTVIGAPGRVSAAEPNEVFELATLLPDGQTALDDNLNAADGRLDTLLGHFDLTFLNLLASDDNSSKFGNGWASGLNGLPLTPDGSIFIKVTGAENTLFSPDINSHTEFGFYQIYFDFYASGGEFLETVILGVESLQHDLDAFAIFGNPLRAGGTVDVHIDNLIGLGDGDPIDFFVFSGLPAGQPFMAEITAAQFDAGLGLFDAVNGNQLEFAVETAGVLATLSGSVPETGQIVLGVTGSIDADFGGEHAEVGQYSLTVSAVPEPTTAALLGLGGLLGSLLVRRRRTRSGR